MAYQANKPAAADKLSVSQGDIQGNFIAINTYFGVDHADFGDADAGHHYFTVGAAPTPPVDETQAGIYAATVDAKAELYINKNTEQVPFTKALKAAKGYTYLPSGVILQWGPILATHGGTAENFAIVFPHFCINVQLTSIESAGTNNFVSVDTIVPASFKAWSSTRTGGASNTNCYYFAIGY